MNLNCPSCGGNTFVHWPWIADMWPPIHTFICNNCQRFFSIHLIEPQELREDDEVRKLIEKRFPDFYKKRDGKKCCS